MTLRTLRNRCAFALLILCTIYIYGCYATSVHPFYRSTDVVFEKSLLGDWLLQIENEKTILIIKPGAEDNDYLIVEMVGGVAYSYTAHLFEIDKLRFFDVTPANQIKAGHTSDNAHIVFTHSLWKVNQIGDRLDLRLWDEEKLKPIVEAENLPHVVSDDDVVLTGTTDDVQELLRHHMDELFPPEGHSVFRKFKNEK